MTSARHEPTAQSTIRSTSPDDAAQICEIYNHYILHSTVTFEERPITEVEMCTRISDGLTEMPWLVCEQEGNIAGYAYAAKWKARSAYRYSVEATAYVRAGATRAGIGTQLIAALLDELSKRGVHAVMGGIALPNDASVALLQKFGFQKVAHLCEIGRKFDKWLDVTYWQLLLPAP
jgi:L-amino acid N-acyltransferase YncA